MVDKILNTDLEWRALDAYHFNLQIAETMYTALTHVEITYVSLLFMYKDSV